MWLKRFTNYILSNRWQALLLTFGITFIPVIGIVGILIATLVTLRKGILEGAIYTVAATVPFAISAYFAASPDAVVPLTLWAAVGVAVFSNVLTWLFAIMLLRQASWSQILQVAALMGVFVVSIVHLVDPNVADWWATQLQGYYDQATTLTGMAKSQTAATNAEMQMESVNITKQYATGLMTAAVLFNAVMQLIIVRWWQAILFVPGLLRRELHDIRLGKLAGVLFLGSMVLWYLGNRVVLDIMPILYMLFGAAGLSLIHYMFGMMKSSTRWFWIWLMYISLIFALPTSIIFVAVLALFDSWLDIRKRLITVK